MDGVRARLAAARTCSAASRYARSRPSRRRSARAASVVGCHDRDGAIPSSRQARKTRSAISPRFATRSFRIAIGAERTARRKPSPPVRRLLVLSPSCSPTAGARAGRSSCQRARLGHGVGMSQWGARGYAAAGAATSGSSRTTTRDERAPRRARPRAARRGTAAVGRVRARSARRRARQARSGARRAALARASCGGCGRRCACRRRPAAPAHGRIPRRARRALRAGRLSVVNGSRRALPARRRAVGDARRLASGGAAGPGRRRALVRARTLKPGRSSTSVDTRSQVYGGIQAETPTTNPAIAPRPAGRSSGAAASRRPSTTRPPAVARPRSPRPGRGHAGAVSPLSGDPYDRLSPHHRWGPFLLRGLSWRGCSGPRLRTSTSPARRRAGRLRRLKAPGTTRTMLAPDLRRGLGLRSTWFAVRVLQRRPRLERALANRSRGALPVSCARPPPPLGKARVEPRVNGGAWTTPRRVMTLSEPASPSPRRRAGRRATGSRRRRPPAARSPSCPARPSRRCRRSRKARSPSCPSSLVRRSAIRRAVSGPSGRRAQASSRAWPPAGLRRELGSTRPSAASRSAATSCTSPIRMWWPRRTARR